MRHADRLPIGKVGHQLHGRRRAQPDRNDTQRVTPNVDVDPAAILVQTVASDVDTAPGWRRARAAEPNRRREIARRRHTARHVLERPTRGDDERRTRSEPEDGGRRSPALVVGIPDRGRAEPSPDEELERSCAMGPVCHRVTVANSERGVGERAGIRVRKGGG